MDDTLKEEGPPAPHVHHGSAIAYKVDLETSPGSPQYRVKFRCEEPGCTYEIDEVQAARSPRV